MALGQSSYLDDNATPTTSDDVTYYDLTTKTGDRAEINGGLFFATAPLTSSGTGLINAFVRVQDGGGQDDDPGIEQGYNTSYRPVSYEENTSPTFTKQLLLSDVPEVTINGTVYYEFRLDINQLNSGNLLSLDELQIYKSATSAGFAQGTIDGAWFTANATKVYDMDGVDNATDSSVLLDYALQSGSGKSDMFFYVPKSNFGNVVETQTYVTLYSEFGSTGVLDSSDGIVELDDPSNANLTDDGLDTGDTPSAIYGSYITNDGFEEWSVSKAISGTTISGFKWGDTDGDGTWDQGEDALAGWSISFSYTYTIGNGSNAQTITESGVVTTANGTTDDFNNDGIIDAKGQYFIPVVLGAKQDYTITITEQLKEGWVNTYDGSGAADREASVVIDKDWSATDLPTGDFGQTELLNFGNTQYGSITGTKYEDGDGDATTLGDQTPEAGWAVYLFDSDPGADPDFTQAIATDTTDANGNYSFDTLLPGTYWVVEESKAGWTNLTPVKVEVDPLTSGEVDSTGNDFVNFKPEPDIDVEKSVKTNLMDYQAEDADDDPDGLQAGTSSTVSFKVVVTNTGNVALTAITLSDSVVNTVGGIASTQTIVYTPDGDSSTLDAQNVFIDLNGNGSLDSGEAWSNFDTDGDGVIDAGDYATLDVGESFTLYYDLTSSVGQHENTATVSGEDIFLDIPTSDSDDANYYVLANEGPGVRTPGFWQNPNNGGTFWDGIPDNQAHEGPTFPDGDPNVDGNQDLIYLVDTDGDRSTADESIDLGDKTSFGLLIGDYNKNGITDVDDPTTIDVNEAEDTIFITYADALKLINNTKGGNDGIYTIGRDVVATWLNYLGGNNIDPTSSDPDVIANAPRHYIDDAIDWLQEFASDENDYTETYATFQFDTAVKSSSNFWKLASGNEKGHDWSNHHSASAIHSALGGYNEDGTIAGHEYAGDADSTPFTFAVTQLYGVLEQQDDQSALLMFNNSLIAA